MKTSNKSSRQFIILFFCFIFISLNAQSIDSITNAYLNHIKIPREVAYLHLNKSTYIKGEQIGFTAYVLDKESQKSSQLSSNLFVTIEDSSAQVIDKKLLKLHNGLASNIFVIDSSYTSGYYTVKAFTNWMRNFEDQDFFLGKIRIIDPKQERYIESEIIESSIDAQFLPESGHILSDVENIISVIIKDTKGYGAPNLNGEIYDQNNTFITEFNVNHLGIGRFKLSPKYGDNYFAKITYKNKAFEFKVNHQVETTGVILSLSEIGTKLYATLKTNGNSLKKIKDKAFKLYLHNQKGIKPIDIVFDKSSTVTKVVDLTQIPTGVNIFTLFDEHQQPILERLFFNYNTIIDRKTTIISAKKDSDSTSLTFKINNIDPKKFNALSISILPEETKSYKHNHNILSYNLLQPYINGPIEQAQYYFTDVDRKKKFELDNLLLTQGWSSYDWTEIFNSKTIRFPVENGITVKANINSNNTKRTEAFMFQLSNKQKPLIVQHQKDQKSFLVNNVFLEEGESINISEVKKNGSLNIPTLYLQSFPNNFPVLNSFSNPLNPKQNYSSYAFTNYNNEVDFTSITNVQELDEVVVVADEAKRAAIRAGELSSGRFGRVKVITEHDRKLSFVAEDYIMMQGVKVVKNFYGDIIFVGRYGPMGIFIDDMFVGGYIKARSLQLIDIDFVEIDELTYNQIKFYTNINDPKKVKKRSKDYDLPLKFAANKKFYTPKYKYYNDEFYLKYGTIDWKPQVQSDENGIFSLKIKNTDIPMTLFIEGVSSDGRFIYNEKSISLN